MNAIRFYGANNVGLPEAWPAEVRVGVSELPAGFDVLMTDAELAAHCQPMRAAVEAWKQSQPVSDVTAPVPNEITPRQLRLWLVNHGISLAAIDAALPNEAARIEWEYANFYERSNPLVNQLATALGLDADVVFREAATL